MIRIGTSAAESAEVLIASIGDYAIYVLDPGGQVATWNPGAERIKGYAASEIVGRNFSLFYTPEDREAGAPERELLAGAASFGQKLCGSNGYGNRACAQVHAALVPRGEKGVEVLIHNVASCPQCGRQSARREKPAPPGLLATGIAIRWALRHSCIRRMKQDEGH